MAFSFRITNKADRSQPPEVGQAIHHFRLEDRLGVGSTGPVYRAWDEELKRRVAVKFMDLSLYGAVGKGTEGLQSRFVREAKILAAMEHPSIVRIYEMVLDDAWPFFVMDYIEGGTLEARRKAHSAFSYLDICNFALQITAALEYAWDEHRIIHRDLKPTNIMFGDDDKVMLTDMGFAKAVGSAVINIFATSDHMVVGTPKYMAPEQHLGAHDLDPRCDIFSLGILLCELMTFRYPFVQRNADMDYFERKQLGLSFPIARYAIGAPPELIRLVEMMLEPSRDFRDLTYAQIREALATVAERLQRLQDMSAPPAPNDSFTDTVVIPRDGSPR